MSGVLSACERNRLIERLRKAAQEAVNCGYCIQERISTEIDSPRQLVLLVQRWRDFPENYLDRFCPSPADVLLIIERLDREEAERKRLEELIKRVS